MTEMTHQIGNMTPGQESLHPDVDFVIEVKLPRNSPDEPISLNVLANPSRTTQTVDLRTPGTLVPTLPLDVLTQMILPEGSVRYCTGGAGKWFWVGAVATDA